MKTYLEIQVPLRWDAAWFAELRHACHDVPVIWQRGFYHITMVFIDYTPEDIDLCPILEKHLSTFPAPEINFDKLDVFPATSGMYIINLTASQVPQSFLSVIEAIRAEMKGMGCLIDTNFRLHVTLGRVKDPNQDLSIIQETVNSISLPSFSLMLRDVDYRVFRGRSIYETKLNSNNI